MNGSVNVPGVSYPEFKDHKHEGYAPTQHTHDYAPTQHTHDYAPTQHTHNYAPTQHTHAASDIGAVALVSLMALAHQQLDSSGNPTVNVISAYPTTPGVYRVGAKGSMNLPGEWGTLLIFNGGGYWLHLFSGLDSGIQGLWWARSENDTAVATWNKVLSNVLTANEHGDEFPSNPVKGQLFFKKRVT